MADVASFVKAVENGDLAAVRRLLSETPSLVNAETGESNEKRAIHYAVLRRNAAMAQLLMEAGADARRGVYPHRDATAAHTLAVEHGYTEIVAIIEAEEQRRREENSCPNATVTPVQEQILAAIRDGATALALEKLSADRSLIQACDIHGASPLHAAAAAGDIDLARWLLEHRADPRKPDLRGFAPIDRASSEEMATLLLEHGAVITPRSAVLLGDTYWLRKFTADDPAILVPRDWQSGGLLTLAVQCGRLEIVRLLLDLGADVDERTPLSHLENAPVSWGGPLWHAALQNHYDIAKLLLDSGADPNANVYASGWPLRNAWNHEDRRIRTLLLERGARPQPYMFSEDHDVEAARALLEHDPSEGNAQELAWSAADHGCPEIVALALPLLDWPRDDPRWHWLLIQPPRGVGDKDPAPYYRCLELLLDRADPNVSRRGHTVLHFVAGARGIDDDVRARFAEILLAHGARLDIRDDLLESTPIDWARRWSRPALLHTLENQTTLS